MRIREDYLAGFPWHPHRGIETITYVLAGSVEHGDSLGNKGKMTAGDVQWMTAGSGILHQEMPKGDPQGRMHGFQLWANLPASLKMTDPRYQDIPASAIPEVTDDDGTRVRVICGEFWGKKGPVEGVAADPNYLDISVAPGQRKRLKIETTRNAFAYVFAGSGTFRDASDPRAVLTESGTDPTAAPVYDVSNHSLVLFDRGDEIARAGRRRGHPVPAGIGQADRGAGGVVRPDRDEHAGTAAPGHGRTANRRLHQTSLKRAGGVAFSEGLRFPTPHPSRCLGRVGPAFDFLFPYNFSSRVYSHRANSGPSPPLALDSSDSKYYPISTIDP